MAELELTTINEVLKRQQSRLYGKYRGRVVDNADPDRRGRLKLQIPTLFGTTETDWIIGAFLFGGNSGEAAIFIPAIGSHVLVEFIEGDKGSPIWTAAYYPAAAQSGNGATPPESFDLDQGSLHQIRTEQGVELRLEDDRADPDDGGRQQLILRHPRGAEIRIDANGVVTISDREGAEVLLDPEAKVVRLSAHGSGSLEMTDDATVLAHGDSKLKLDGSGATVTGTKVAVDGDSVTLGKNATAPLVNAQAWITAYSTHVHPCPTGSTTPPAPPDPTLLQRVSLTKVKGA